MPNPSPAPRVLYFTDTYPPQVNGVSVVTALSVAGLRARGWEVGVVRPAYPASMPNAFPVSRSDATEFAVELPSTPMPGYRDLRLSLPSPGVISRAIERFRPDLVHCATEFLIGRAGQKAALRHGIGAVSSYHTDFSKYTESYGVPWLRAPVARSLMRFHQRSLRVYTPSAPARDDLRRLGVTDVEVWGRGVDLELFSPVHRDPLVHRWHGGGDAIVLLHVGRLAAEKGIEMLVQAFLLAQRRLAGVQDIRLVIAGEGPREDALRALAGDQVNFLGNLDRRTILPRLYASCDGFLFASETETLGLVVLEAMASGLPVIAAPAGGVADHLRDDVNGLAFPAGDLDAMVDAIVRFCRSAELRQRLGAGARDTVVPLGWEEELDRLDASYRDVLRERRYARSA